MTAADIVSMSDPSKLEKDILAHVLMLEDEFRGHNSLMRNEILVQKDLISRLWLLAQRYILLASTGPCCKFPDIYAAPAEETILHEFSEKLQALKSSNSSISASVNELRKSCRIFDNLCSQLDMSKDTTLINGDTFHKPLSFFIELISDLFKYFHAWFLKLEYSSRLIDPYKCEGIEKYKTLLEPSEDFEEYLNVGLTYCKCLRPKKEC